MARTFKKEKDFSKKESFSSKKLKKHLKYKLAFKVAYDDDIYINKFNDDNLK